MLVQNGFGKSAVSEVFVNKCKPIKILLVAWDGAEVHLLLLEEAAAEALPEIWTQFLDLAVVKGAFLAVALFGISVLGS
jgi:hypothetical protein